MCCTSQHINFKAEDSSSAIPIAATHHASGTPHCPRQGRCSCLVPQNLDFMLRWRRISTRRLTEALPKTRPVLVLHLAAHLLQIRAPIQCAANRCNPSCQRNTALPKARQGKCSCCVLQNVEFKLRWRRTSTRQLTEALPKAGQVLMLHRRTATSKQSTHPVLCHPAATHRCPDSPDR